MMTLIRKSWLNFFRREQPEQAQVKTPGAEGTALAQTVEFDFAPNDPLLAYLLSVSSVVEVDKLHLDSPTLRKLKEAGTKLVVPLISQGELIGLLNLGPRRSEQEYSTDDRRLLNTLAAQAAPALRVAQLARQQQAEARERERMAQELRVARVIQQTLLPKELPVLPGWKMAAHWQPARAVSGDFYDFVHFPDGKIAIITGDVTDKGVPAALVMATTRSILRTSAEHLVSPGEVLRQANNMLCPDIPPNMFVTCLYVLLDPATGDLRYANAGHNVPYICSVDGVTEMRARGMPLGLLPDMAYEELEANMPQGSQVIMYSDGLVEAHNTQKEIFGFPRLRELLSDPHSSDEPIQCLLEALNEFVGPDWEQEDDVTFVSLRRENNPAEAGESRTLHEHSRMEPPDDARWRKVGAFQLNSKPGNEREAMERVANIVTAERSLPKGRIERLKTAVAEATMNAMEHGNHYQPDKPVNIEVLLAPQSVAVRITDHGGSASIPDSPHPDLDAKLAGLQSPRGWGLFLIKSMVDEMRVESDDTHHTVELILHLEEENQHDQYRL